MSLDGYRLPFFDKTKKLSTRIEGLVGMPWVSSDVFAMLMDEIDSLENFKEAHDDDA